MKNKRSARSARTTAKNIHISQGGRDLTAQAGLIPVVKFFHKEGIVSKTEQTVDHRRGATGLYDAVDMVILSVVGIVWWRPFDSFDCDSLERPCFESCGRLAEDSG